MYIYSVLSNMICLTNMKEESEINLGLIGLGKIGVVHAEVLKEPNNQTGIVLKAIADPLPKRIFRGIDHQFDYRELLKIDDIHVVTVSTPPDTHFQICADSLNAGKHVLVEKPPALTLKELRKMSELARKKGLVLFTAFHSAYSPVIEAARRELAGQKIRRVEISFKENRIIEDPNDWVLNPQRAGGGALMDSGINAISIIRYISTDLKDLEVTGSKLHSPPQFRVETEAKVDFTFGDSGEGTLEMDWFYKGAAVHDIAIFTESGEYKLKRIQGQLFKNGKLLLGDLAIQRNVSDQHVEYRRVYRDFANHIRDGSSYISSLELKFVLDAYGLS